MDNEKNWKMFNAIAGRYDFLNRLLSLGQDIRWRKALKQFLPDTDGQIILDLATGTADVLIALTRIIPKSIAAMGWTRPLKCLRSGKRKSSLAFG